MNVGFRAWLPEYDERGPCLGSLISSFKWNGPVVSTGMPRDGLEDENIVFNLNTDDPTMGIHSYNSYKNLMRGVQAEETGGLLLGAIQPYGTVIFHETGFRSQKAQVLAICKETHCDFLVDMHERIPCKTQAEWVDGYYFFCTDHAREYIGFTGQRDDIVDFEIYIGQLSRRYGCDIVDLTELSKLKEKYCV